MRWLKSEWQNASVARRWTSILASLLIVSGLALVADGMWIKSKAIIAQALLDRAFIGSVANSEHEGHALKPWPWADIRPVAQVTAPRLSVSNIVLDNVSGEALAFGPGHVPGTARPGEPGTMVFSAHRDTHFSWIGELVPGDLVKVRGLNGKVRNYRISRAWVARYDAPGINAQSSNNRIALTTCWPLNATRPGPLRYIVQGEEVVAKARLGRPAQWSNPEPSSSI